MEQDTARPFLPSQGKRNGLEKRDTLLPLNSSLSAYAAHFQHTRVPTEQQTHSRLGLHALNAHCSVEKAQSREPLSPCKALSTQSLRLENTSQINSNCPPTTTPLYPLSHVPHCHIPTALHCLQGRRLHHPTEQSTSQRSPTLPNAALTPLPPPPFPNKHQLQSWLSTSTAPLPLPAPRGRIW